MIFEFGIFKLVSWLITENDDVDHYIAERTLIHYFIGIHLLYLNVEITKPNDQLYKTLQKINRNNRVKSLIYDF